jgi:hypothetical protein
MRIKITKPKSVENGVRLYATVQRNPHVAPHQVVYLRTANKKRWTCDCPDFTFRENGKGRHCDHIKQVRAKIERQKEATRLCWTVE